MSPLRSGLGPLEPKWREIFCFADLICVPQDGLEFRHTLCAQHFQIGLLSVASEMHHMESHPRAAPCCGRLPGFKPPGLRL